MPSFRAVTTSHRGYGLLVSGELVSCRTATSSVHIPQSSWRGLSPVSASSTEALSDFEHGSSMLSVSVAAIASIFSIRTNISIPRHITSRWRIAALRLDSPNGLPLSSIVIRHALRAPVNSVVIRQHRQDALPLQAKIRQRLMML